MTVTKQGEAPAVVKIFFEYLGYLGILLGVVGIILLLLKIIGVF